jgi:DNA-directed RNA polymerase specialized sigma24 family protein
MIIRHEARVLCAEFVCREHRLAFTFLAGSDRPGLSVVAAVLFFVVPPPNTKVVRGEKGQAMRRVRRWARGARLPLYRWIIGHYAPYVLVRCARFTNSRRQAQQIGVYTLVTTCLLAHKLRHAGQLTLLVDTMADVIGPDVVLGGPAADPRDDGDEPLIADPRVGELVEALNLLPRSARAVLVLHCSAGPEPDDLAKLLHRPTAGILARVTRAEARLAECLAGLRPDGGPVGRAEVRSLLAQFAAGLDTGWLQGVRDCTLGYLRRRHERDPRPQGCWHLN